MNKLALWPVGGAARSLPVVQVFVDNATPRHGLEQDVPQLLRCAFHESVEVACIGSGKSVG
eukprot:11184475-Lingulodinium_polyedra.AAC.1